MGTYHQQNLLAPLQPEQPHFSGGAYNMPKFIQTWIKSTLVRKVKNPQFFNQNDHPRTPYNQGCYVRYFSAKSALRAFNLWSALECVKGGVMSRSGISIDNSTKN